MCVRVHVRVCGCVRVCACVRVSICVCSRALTAGTVTYKCSQDIGILTCHSSNSYDVDNKMNGGVPFSLLSFQGPGILNAGPRFRCHGLLRAELN